LCRGKGLLSSQRGLTEQRISSRSPWLGSTYYFQNASCLPIDDSSPSLETEVALPSFLLEGAFSYLYFSQPRISTLFIEGFFFLYRSGAAPTGRSFSPSDRVGLFPPGLRPSPCIYRSLFFTDLNFSVSESRSSCPPTRSRTPTLSSWKRSWTSVCSSLTAPDFLLPPFPQG